MFTREEFDAGEFREMTHFEGPLGALWTREATEFRLWAPTAEAAALRLYREGTGGRPFRRVRLTPGDRGVWSARVPGDLDGVYYDYMVTAGGAARRTADPYARACGLNGQRSMVIDLARTDPEGWAADAPPARGPETVICEVHVKDFSWDPASGVPETWRGKYKALTLDNTTLRGEGDFPTCVGHLRELGVTHVQLMPVFDAGSVDEGGDPAAFNWGYDPENYNVPEGAYATDPRDGAVRIRELKEAILAMHRSGFRVIMDVVYNHTYRRDSWLERTVPGYYYRAWEDGSWSNGSGCGNDLASERSMCGQYILDSVLYWAREYHMDGFRFDLMGLLDVPLMNRIRAALDETYGPGEKLMLGEPWRAGDTAMAPGTVPADKGHVYDLDDNIAVFCDNTRDALKGGLWNEGDRGLANGGGLDGGLLRACLTGWAGSAVKVPSQTVNYLSCHDDWTLWDKLTAAGDPERDFTGWNPAILRQNRLAAALNFACQGNLFLLSGEEFGRTKRGVKNSYRSPLTVNALDWTRARDNRALTNYYRGLIALRKRLPCLRDKGPGAAARLVLYREFALEAAAVLWDNAGDSPWDQVLTVFNLGESPAALDLPQGRWQVLADGESSFAWREERFVESEVTVAGVSALFLGRS